MTGTYAMGPPWLRFASECGPGAKKDLGEFLAWMTGAKTKRAQSSSSWGPWAMFGGSAPFRQWGEGGPGWRAMKARRGDVRAAILAVLNESAMNGYQIIQEIAERSGGVWKPSPGSIYPTLQQLEDEGLVRQDTDGGKRIFTLTDEGKAYVAEHVDEVSAPWQAMSEASGDDDGLKPLIGQVAAAVWQILAVGTPQQQAQSREALLELRKRLYAILAEDDARVGDSR
jgi:DNA-binding PadR family transcriptional regulator